MTATPQTSAHVPDDWSLAELVDQLTARLQAGERVDLESVARQYPAHAAELRELFPALAGLGDLLLPGANAAGDPLSAALGDYRLVREVGRGGMGVVYEAVQLSLNRRVALKVLPFASTMDPRQLQRFRHEAQAAAMLHHTNIVPVHGVGCERGVHYYAMQLIDGRSLADAIAEWRAGRVNAPVKKPTNETIGLDEENRGVDTPRSPETPPVAALSTRKDRTHFRRVAELTAQAADALEYAHSMGVVHRDIKPANLLLDEAGHLWVTDFGLAKFDTAANLTVSGDLIGTLRYMSPEQALARQGMVDHRTDVYSLGATFYELLTLHPPLDGSDKHELLRKIAFEEPRPPRKIDRAIPEELATVALKCLAKNPAERYATAGELADDLRRWLGDQAIRAKPPSLTQRMRRWGRKHRPVVVTAAYLLAMLAVTLVGATAVSVWYAVEADHARTQADDRRRDAVASAAEAKRQTAEAQTARQDAERQRNAVSQNLYFADIRLGLVDWTAGNLSRLSRKLADHVPPTGRDDFRGWEWYYLLALCHQDERTLMDHATRVTSVAWSPDGRHVASTSHDGFARVWDATSWRLLRTFHLSIELKQGVAWSPDSQWLAWGAVGPDNAVYVWHVPGDEVKSLRGHTSSVWSVAWSPDGRHLASAGLDQTIRIWEPATGSCVKVSSEAGNNILSVAWSPDGNRLASTSEYHGLKVWDAASGQVLRDDLFRKHASSVAWSPDGKQLALGTGAGQCVLYHTADWTEVARWDGHVGGVKCVAWNPEGSRLASAGTDNLIRLWGPAGGACLLTLGGHLSPVHSVAWEPNGKRLASASTDGTVKVWPVPTPPQPRRLEGRPGGVQAIAWGDEPDALRAFDAKAGSITLWDVATGQRRGQTAVPSGSSGQFSAGGKLLAVAATDERPSGLLVYDARTGRPAQAMPATVAGAATFSADASLLAIGTWGGRLEIADLRRSEVVFRWQGTRVWAIAWSPNGPLLAAAGRGESSDGGYLAHAGWVHVFDSGKRERVLKLRHGTSQEEATAVTWSPDGRRLVSGDGNGLAEVWEMPTGQKVASANLHTARIHALAWSPDGRRIASASADKTVRVWDPTRGEELLKLEVPDAEAKLLQWSPDGRRLAAAGADGTIRIWDASAGYRFIHSETYARDQARARLKEVGELWNRGRRADALALHAQTLEQLKTTLGPDHDDTLENMDDLGMGYRIAGRLPEAVALHERALELSRAKHGSDHSDTLMRANYLAYDYVTADRLAEAIALLEPVVAKQRTKYGYEGLHTVTVTNNLADAYIRAGRPQDAIGLLKASLQELTAREGSDQRATVLCMQSLAGAYDKADQCDRAEPLWVAAVAWHRKRDGPQSDRTATVLAALGANRLTQRKYTEAEPPLRECLAIRAGKTPNDWTTFSARALLGGSLLGQQKYAEAESLLHAGYEGMKQREGKIPPEGKVRVTEAVDRLVQLYEATGETEKAAAWRKKQPVARPAKPAEPRKD